MKKADDNQKASNKSDAKPDEAKATKSIPLRAPPITNYTLSTICPVCNHPVVRRACKVRCENCGFMWDCSEV